MLLAPHSAPAQDEKRQEELSRWMVYYYLHPQPDAVVKSIMAMSSVGIFDNENALPPVIAFYSRIFIQNPGRLRAWFAELERLPKDHRKIMWLALWHADTPETVAQLKLIYEKSSASDKEQLKEMLQSQPQSLTEIEIVSGAELDMLWGAFMATGDEKYVIRIISVLAWADENKDAVKAVIGKVARWSLTS